MPSLPDRGDAVISTVPTLTSPEEQQVGNKKKKKEGERERKKKPLRVGWAGMQQISAAFYARRGCEVVGARVHACVEGQCTMWMGWNGGIEKWV